VTHLDNGCPDPHAAEGEHDDEVGPACARLLAEPRIVEEGAEEEVADDAEDCDDERTECTVSHEGNSGRRKGQFGSSCRGGGECV